jgi:coenzyme F420-dependent glucose-6-phosphate dehydrogenase
VAERDLKIGFTLSSEEQRPGPLVQQAARAEQAGFDFALVSDHFHPWTDTQGQSPFVWAVLGGISQSTRTLHVGTGVTCPMRVHPAIVAQAAATVAAMMPGRFFLGMGTGENLNEHILGQRWPPVGVRREMLEEAVEVVRKLWSGSRVTHHGTHYTVEDARPYTLPGEPPPIMLAAAGNRAARLAGRKADGLIAVVPKAELVETFSIAGGESKPRYGQLHVCWGVTEEAARRTAYQRWPNAAMPGSLASELRLPDDFAEVALMLSEDDVAQSVVCGPDPERHAAAIDEFVTAGFDHVYVHQVGPELDGFFDFYQGEVLALVRSRHSAG